MIKLGVNVDHVATVRQARLSNEPDPVRAAVLAELGGADGITVHLREDRRHIQERDLRLLREIVKTRLNLEMACNEEILKIALDVKPDMCTLVPEKREELTTEGGLDVISHFDVVKECVEKLNEAGIEVSIFIDPDESQLEKAIYTGAKYVELHTGRYADAKGDDRIKELKRLKLAAKVANNLGFVVNAGHGLDYMNIIDVIKIPHIYEVNIGHSIVARSIYVGMEEAVREMKEIICKHSVEC
ncbi:pyridoxine 5'-phosphate synthase [Deferribacter autotrophicus]|uniref:Pyridoxine 5'-phosphate synthase n=1 Tax=Deferribacter autotrophicus TaxID=500465 RepID=A0A5A8F557_9BACT|nr:pyridoxine 5'-phosphate synthase [Deferribacter autotrophicus]KAA0258185.1 pyridoxine 5'-phosphate synthase [Deferribacter autotrophicus]